jgi:hypothetical protein
VQDQQGDDEMDKTAKEKECESGWALARQSQEQREDQARTGIRKAEDEEKASDIQAFQHGVFGRLAAEARFPIKERQDEDRETIGWIHQQSEASLCRKPQAVFDNGWHP